MRPIYLQNKTLVSVTNKTPFLSTIVKSIKLFKLHFKEANRQSAIVELLKNNIGKHTIVKLLNVSYEEVEILELEYCSKRR